MSSITLNNATQQNLLSLQTINAQMDTTQNALATGLKVSNASENAVAYFQAQSLDNRASDLTTRKDTIDQGISSVTTATQGIQSAISVLQQMQGLLESASTETATQRASAAVSFNTLSTQLNQLLNDSSYQGLNLVNSSSSNLTLQFSQSTSSVLKIAGQNLLMSMLMSKVDKVSVTKVAYTGSHAGIEKVAYTGGTSAGSHHSAGSGYSAYQKYSLATAGTGHSAGSNHSAGSGYSHFKITDSGHSAGSGYSAFQRYTGSSHSAGSHHSAGSGTSNYNVTVRNVTSFNKASMMATALAGAKFSTAVSTGKTSAFTTAYNSVNNAIATLQAAAQNLGSNVSFLQTRLAFTEQYITTLQGGASKLTVADLNAESTNLVTLQTRQQLAIESLSIATQAQQNVLRLFH